MWEPRSKDMSVTAQALLDINKECSSSRLFSDYKQRICSLAPVRRIINNVEEVHLLLKHSFLTDLLLNRNI
jgi:hypothetical protein